MPSKMPPPPPPAQPASLRQGPRPLPLHLAAASFTWTSSLAALPLLRNGLLALRPELAAAGSQLTAELVAAEPEALAGAVAREAQQRFASFLDAIATYRRHPFRRSATMVPVIWQEGTTRLLDYGGNGPPVLVVPSLINRAYILDLLPERSFMRFLAERGFRPFLVDWQAPGEAERHFDLADYVLGRLAGALDAVIEVCGPRSSPGVILVGYCMGGTLALGLAQHRASDLAGLALLATPWDFHAERVEQAELLAALLPGYEPVLGVLGELPIDMIQALFAALDPSLVLRKFLGFAGLDPASEKARQFVALEDWLNDGVPLAASVARECLGQWYGANATARGAWRLRGHAVLPQRIKTPSLAVIPDQDRIVPPGSALALAEVLPDCRVLRAPTGHIGMMSGGRAEAAVWRPFAEWALSCTAASRPIESKLKAKRRSS
ncbi:MAG TPA: alpha/beta fold hydrolase [Dongiaceae bacterium]|nr:alpha/beta fold hydrolase [Dongiaceae bacterium]